MSWLFSQVLVEEYLGDISLDGEQSVQSSGSNTQLAYCAPDKMTKFSRLSQYGMTYKPLTENLGEALLMSFRAGFHAKTSPLLEKGRELMESDQECGEKWRGSFTKYDPDSSLWKTHQCSLLGDLDEFSETWPQWGLMRDGECWEQRTLEQTIRGTGFGLSENKWPTPLTQDSYERSAWKIIAQANEGGKARMTLTRKVKYLEKMPTPTAHMAKETNVPSEHKRNTQTLTAQVNWPTPVTRDYKDSGSQEALIRARDKRDSPGLGLLVGAEGGGNLNPTWVEWLMGWPLGWTDLKPLETDKCLYARQQHGEY